MWTLQSRFFSQLLCPSWFLNGKLVDNWPYFLCVQYWNLKMLSFLWCYGRCPLVWQVLVIMGGLNQKICCIYCSYLTHWLIGLNGGRQIPSTCICYFNDIEVAISCWEASILNLVCNFDGIRSSRFLRITAFVIVVVLETSHIFNLFFDKMPFLRVQKIFV